MATLATVLKIGADISALQEGMTRGAQAMERMESHAAKMSTAMDKAGGFLKSTFAQYSAASLATGVLQGSVGGMEDLVATGLKLGPTQQSFTRLATTVKQDSSAMLRAMTDGTRGLVSNYDLMTGANKAMLLGLPVTTQSMGELARIAT